MTFPATFLSDIPTALSPEVSLKLNTGEVFGAVTPSEIDKYPVLAFKVAGGDHE